MPTVSLITVNHNTRECLGSLFESVFRQTRPADEVLLVDNSSTDDSVEFVRRNWPSVRVIPLEKNYGFAEGVNAGVREASGEYIALINSDVILHPEWLQHLSAALEADRSIGAAVPKIYRTGEPRILEQAGAEFNQLGHCWTRGFGEPDRGQYDQVTDVPALTACAVLIRRSIIGDEPVFDPDFFMYGEEFELTLRLRGRGFRIVLVPAAICDHRGRYSVTKAVSDPRIYQQFFCNRNRVKTLFKYYPLRVLLPNLPLTLLSLAYWDLVFLRRSGLRYFAHAVADQCRYLAAGLRERGRSGQVDSERWLVWMTTQNLREIRTLARSRSLQDSR